MRLIADTNVVISGLLWQGTPARLLELANDSQIALFTSAALLAELRKVLMREKFARRVLHANTSVEELIADYQAVARVVPVKETPRVVPNDPADDHVLAAALAAHAHLIVSGDAHLLDLKQYRNTPIVAAAQALQLIANAS